MKKDTIKYIQNCSICQLKKKTQKTGFEEMIKRLEEIWKQIFMNHVIKLLKVKEKDSILIIQDQFSSIIHLRTISKKENSKKI